MAKATQAATDTENLNFEQAMAELESIVRKLESGTADLDSTITDYERGMKLKQTCEARLEAARLKVESIFKQADGSLATKPLDSE